ncbi:MAG: dihydrolipoyllysine succinyltransferase [Thermococcus sp.]|mgnify:CR=1 FL=1|uniref:biotin/lipoyl-containing protein n=1 Tax=Thermococcus sp. TaxID=35749 RepID=UPI000F173B70|nr:biotin/lipoyl-containing protein [Thermococcus sp.]RLF76887.1 MAG: dihydrolipoyllysine succinyltransferase [Thermococci archaeon]MCD6140144.1 dihydrolipoyllysine succinyltransferase [Thermococcus sp.]MCD6142841.1 dihydrolipoyllysine succinyltransferase [Thermococcus sp.]RLF78776.1 MAG: dihydrolipoyllysine succinyltransferase [Thermococci archaeon]RLF85496.1 MAG: dihydrolipoyllysine succinyltransferase [Thermococci archaeon]
MEIEVKVPIVSQEDKKGVVNQWYKKDGDVVEEGEEIAEVMIEKVTVLVKAPASGKLKILVPENGEVSQGDVIAVVETA